jgi:hypothetical protein
MFLPQLPPPDLTRAEVAWTTPSKDASGSMPIGNGEVVLNVWVEDKTGDLLILIARTDALSEISRILKLGRVRVHFSQPLFTGPGFRQKLAIKDGRIDLKGNGETLRLFVDSGANVIHLAGKFKTPQTVTATLEDWRKEDRKLPGDEGGSAWSVNGAPFPLVESADRFFRQADALKWVHRNETSVVPKLWENQSLTGLPGAFDPLLYRTFGGTIVGKGFIARSEDELETSVPVQNLDLSIATHTWQGTLEAWDAGLGKQLRESPLAKAEKRTADWWHEFWNRSFVHLPGASEDAELIDRGYNLQRYVQACQGRGEFPIKFNGGYYTVEPAAMGKPFNPDWRQWGDPHWYQNVRHTVAPMLASGDFDQMESFFRLYERVRPLAESRTQKYHGAQGAYFPETMTVFGTYSGGDYGWDRTGKKPADVDSPWWRYAWNQGPELLLLMLDRYDYTGDEAFLKKRVLPMAESVLRYFDTRFKKDANGRIILDPAQVVETYWEGVVNDTPTTSGIFIVTQRLATLPPKLLTAKQRGFFAHMQEARPTLALVTENGVTRIDMARKYDATKISNVENGALYATWPFRLATLAHPELLSAGKAAYAVRKNRLDNGWGYDGNAAALLGMTEEAARILKVKVRNSNPNYRWPATWGPNYDWLPDQNHGGNLLNETNLMLIQAEPLSEGGAIRLLPAWPKAWDVEFKLHAPGNTVVHAKQVAGKVTVVSVTPESRRKDVILP